VPCKLILPFCIKTIDTTRQKAETHIFPLSGVDALLYKGLSCVDQALSIILRSRKIMVSIWPLKPLPRIAP
jgi:hypothetical protein